MGRQKTPESDAQATRERIIATAEGLFKDVGYVKTTVADIAGSLGMSPSNIYRYFPTKAHINEEICDRLVRGVESRCVDAVGREGTARERITAFVMAYHRQIRGSILRGNRLYDMVGIAMEQHWPVIQGHSERVRGILHSLLKEGVAVGEFKDMDAGKVARAMQEAIATFVYPHLLEHWVNDFSDAGQEDSVEGQLMFLLGMLFYGVCNE